MTDLLYLFHQLSIPSGTGIHIIVHVQDIVCCCVLPAKVHRQANSNIGHTVIEFEIGLLLHPFQGTIAAIIYMNDDLMGNEGVLPDALDTTPEIGKIIPGRNED